MNWLIYLIAGFVALLILPHFFALRCASHAKGKIAPDTKSVDGNAGEYERRVYYFYASHCGPCRAMTPLVDRLRTTHRNLIKIDVNYDIELARGFEVAATPSFAVVENGLISQVRLGAQREEQLLNLLRSNKQ